MPGALNIGEIEFRASAHSSDVTNDKLFNSTTKSIRESKGNCHTPCRFPDLRAH